MNVNVTDPDGIADGNDAHRGMRPSIASYASRRRVRLEVTAAEVAARIAARNAHWCWFDGDTMIPGMPQGVETSPSREWSYLGVAAAVLTAEPGEEREFLAELRSSRQLERRQGLHSGWAVTLAYEFGVALLGVQPAPDGQPPAFALRLDVVLAMHPATGHAELRGVSDEAIDAWLEQHGAALARASHSDPAPHRVLATPSHEATWRQSDAQYLALIEACRSAIREGDAYVLCLTDTASVADLNVAPLDLYAALQRQGGALRGGVIQSGDRALVSASPERFLRVENVGRRAVLSTHPIKGTRPRGASGEHDRALAAELAADPKERAENLMIVDLMRNDFSRVCEASTIEVPRFQRVETHPHVHQLVSTVTGRLREGVDTIDAIAACFPGGSMTGTPKRRAVQLLQQMERGPRGLYAGCFGWIDDAGEAELAMTIRSVELRRDPVTQRHEAFVGAGGGITADSVARLELAEKHLKAAPLLSTLATSASRK